MRSGAKDEMNAAPILSAILPPAAIAAEILGEATDVALLPEEAAILSPAAVEKRRREFATGRTLARRALQRLGVAPVAIRVGAKRQPLWPEGVIGSITHCRGYCAAAVAFAADLCSIGIDAEVHDRLPGDVISHVTRPEERAWIESRAGDSIFWDRLFFSAKESVFKAWFPLMGRWLAFDDASLEIDVEAGTFRASLVTERVPLGGCVLTGFEGRYLLYGNHVFTSVVIEPPRP